MITDEEEIEDVLGTGKRILIEHPELVNMSLNDVLIQLDDGTEQMLHNRWGVTAWMVVKSLKSFKMHSLVKQLSEVDSGILTYEYVGYLLQAEYQINLEELILEADRCGKFDKIMLDTFLYEYSFVEAHCQYLFYLTLKYKDVVEFNNIFLKNQITKNIQKVNFKEFPCIKESIGNITTIIEDLQYKIITEQYREGIRDQEGEIYRIASVNNNTIKLRRFNGVNSGYTVEISLDTRLNNLLFAPDVKKWEQIKYMEYGHYIHQQLEMFNFIEMDSK